MKQLEILDWAISGVVDRMHKDYTTPIEKEELERKLKLLARLYVLEKNKDDK